MITRKISFRKVLASVISGLLNYSLFLTDKPDIKQAIGVHTRNKQRRVRAWATNLKITKQTPFESYKGALPDIWKRGEDSTVYYISMKNLKSARGHPGAFVKRRDRGYLLLPIASLFFFYRRNAYSWLLLVGRDFRWVWTVTVLYAGAKDKAPSLVVNCQESTYCFGGIKNNSV